MWRGMPLIPRRINFILVVCVVRFRSSGIVPRREPIHSRRQHLRIFFSDERAVGEAGFGSGEAGHARELAAKGRAGTGEKDQLEKAAEANPVLRGDVNFDPRQYDRYIAGNTVDENAALKEIANRIVTQQLAAEPAPVALDVTLPERGTVMTFGRSVQVDGERAIGIDLGLKRTGSGGWWIGLLGCLAVAVLGWRAHGSYGRA